jgi:DNA-binding HxlR family transcriptional regulator
MAAEPDVAHDLTPAGQALLPVLRGLTAWAEDNLPA